MTDIESELATVRKRLLDWLLNDALPIWWEVGADKTGGGFHEAIDLAGKPVQGERRARVQARQIFTYAVAGEMGWTGPWRQAVRHGLDYYLGRYRRPDGLFVNALQADGSPSPATPHLYEQAFALLALATAGESASVPIADTVRDKLSADRRGAAGGYTGFADDRFFQSDPHMHLFEAALAWERISADPRWCALADEVAELCLARFMTPGGLLLEYFDATWAPAAGLQGRLAWPGHQFEWAGLLERWALRRGREDVRAVARRLYRYGADHGIDAKRGVAVFELLDDLSVNDAKARLWSQTEWLKAALILARAAGGDERQRYLADAIAAAKALWLYLDTPIAGLWRDKLLADGSWVDEPAPASSFYHIIDALRVLAAWPADPMLNDEDGQ
jgi:mannose/cellobiose epimerase-like protein (N-acyl-D-glucosamine 2-epimerase family)